MNHMNLSDELRQQLLEAAAWGKAGITVSQELLEEGKKSKGTKKEEEAEGGDPKAFGGKKGDKSQTSKGGDYVCADTEHDDGEDLEELEEAVHACPLCASQLDEAIDEERLLEHLNVVMGLVDRLSQLHEGDEDIDVVIDETLADLLLQAPEEEEYDEE